MTLLLSGLVALSGCGGASPAPAPASPRGVILISVDTLRADHVAGFGGAASTESTGHVLTPTLAALGDRSTRFTRTYAQANETLFSHGSLFTSQLPSRVRPLDYEWTIPDGTPTLAAALSEAGWRTGAMVSGGHLARIFGVDDGFGEYVEAQRWGSFQETVPMALRWLDKAAAAPEPFFLFIHGYDAHAPYTKPHVLGRLASPNYDGPLLEPSAVSLFYERLYKDGWYPDFPLSTLTNRSGTRVLTPRIHELLPEYAARTGVKKVTLTDADRAWLDGMYDTGVLYADLWIGVLLAELERRGLAETTAIAVVSDHGEGLLDHGFFTHRGSLHDASTHVPFVLHLPDAPESQGREVGEVAALLDVAPTLLSWAGVPAPPAMAGRDLLACAREGDCPAGGAAASEGVLEMVSVTDGERRLTVQGAPASSAAMDALLRGVGADDPEAALYDTTRGSGAEVLIEDAEAFERLRAALVDARAAEAGGRR